MPKQQSTNPERELNRLQARAAAEATTSAILLKDQLQKLIKLNSRHSKSSADLLKALEAWIDEA